MTWSGNLKSQDQRPNGGSKKRQYVRRDRGTPSPQHSDRESPVEQGGKTHGIFRFSPRPDNLIMSRTPSPDGNAYAGPKFSEPPSPNLLPKPPSHWMNFGDFDSHDSMSSQLKEMLKVATCIQA